MSIIESYNFHDAQLVKIEFGNECVELVFSLIDSTHVVVHLNGLSRMLCNDLREGNTVLEVAEVNESSTCDTLLCKLFALNEKEKQFLPPYLSEIKKKLANRQLTVFHIAPSYGCNLIALCESIEASQLRTAIN